MSWGEEAFFNSAPYFPTNQASASTSSNTYTSALTSHSHEDDTARDARGRAVHWDRPDVPQNEGHYERLRREEEEERQREQHELVRREEQRRVIQRRKREKAERREERDPSDTQQHALPSLPPTNRQDNKIDASDSGYTNPPANTASTSTPSLPLSRTRNATEETPDLSRKRRREALPDTDDVRRPRPSPAAPIAHSQLSQPAQGQSTYALHGAGAERTQPIDSALRSRPRITLSAVSITAHRYAPISLTPPPLFDYSRSNLRTQSPVLPDQHRSPLHDLPLTAYPSGRATAPTPTIAQQGPPQPDDSMLLPIAKTVTLATQMRTPSAPRPLASSPPSVPASSSSSAARVEARTLNAMSPDSAVEINEKYSDDGLGGDEDVEASAEALEKTEGSAFFP
jgi:hypothetical protein